MATFAGSRRIEFSGTYKSAGDLETGQVPIGIAQLQSYTNGTGANQANAWFSDTRALASSTPETIDLTSGLTDRFGTTIVFATITEILVYNRNTTASQTIALSGNAMTAFGATTETVGPKGIWHVASPVDGFTITNTNQDQFTVTPGAYAVSYDLIIVGRV